jgi:hypothetical protein
MPSHRRKKMAARRFIAHLVREAMATQEPTSEEPRA